MKAGIMIEVPESRLEQLDADAEFLAQQYSKQSGIPMTRENSLLHLGAMFAAFVHFTAQEAREDAAQKERDDE